MTMTHVGTFIPLQAQQTGWGTSGLYQTGQLGNPGLGVNGLGQTGQWGIPGLGVNALGQTGQWGIPGWNPNTGWNPGTSMAFGGQVNPHIAIHTGHIWHPGQVWGTTSTLQPHTGHVVGGWNQSPLWNAASNWGVNAGWNPNPIWNYNTGWNVANTMNHNLGNTPLWVNSTYGTPLNENTQGLTTQGGQIGFVPHIGGITGGSYVQGTGGQQVIGGISHSFATELGENNSEYVISFDVPGINIEDLDISLAGSTILVNGIRKGSHDSSLAYSEITRGSISRAVGVPFEVTPHKTINTSLENGVLKIRIAKDGHSEKKLGGTRKVKIG